MEPLDAQSRRKMIGQPRLCFNREIAMSASTTAEESEQSHSPVEPEDNTLQQASRLDTSRLKGAGGPTYVIIYLHGLQTALDVAGNVR